jgi:transposase
MDIVYNHCCGFDDHKKSTTVYSITSKGKEIKIFGTMTHDLFHLLDCIKSKRCSHVPWIVQVFLATNNQGLKRSL